MVALLMAGGAISLLSCRSQGHAEEDDDYQGLMTQQADSLVIIESKAGKKSFRGQTALMEVYDYAKEPYREFRKGVEIETYADSTDTVESTLIADYAINFINQELWEAKGNVVVTNVKGQVLETQQLFWNQRTGRIYSNVDSKLTQGNDVFIGVSFESDDKFEEWEVRQMEGKAHVEVEPSRDPDTGENSGGLNDGDADGAGTVHGTVESKQANATAANDGKENPVAVEGRGLPAEQMPEGGTDGQDREMLIKEAE